MMRCPRCGGPTLFGPPVDIGRSINESIACPACGVEVGVRSTRKEEPVAKKATVTPRDRDLPGMEDRAIKALEDLAFTYADLRDQRIALNQEEAALKAKLLAEMKRHGKERYRRGKIRIRLVAKETVKVRVPKPDARIDEERTLDRKSAAAGDVH